VGNVSAARKGAHKIIVCLGCPFVAAGATPGDDSYGSGRALQALPQWVRFPPSPLTDAGSNPPRPVVPRSPECAQAAAEYGQLASSWPVVSTSGDRLQRDMAQLGEGAPARRGRWFKPSYPDWDVAQLG
jgi:hypothetical protein